MTRLFKLAIVICFVPVSLSAQTHTTTDQSSEAREVKAVVEQFYKLQSEGTWLVADRWHELTDFFTSVQSWPPDDPVTVLKSYRIDDAKRSIVDGKENYEVEVDCFVWGSINSFLRFTRAELPKRNSPVKSEPVERSAKYSLSLTDRFVMGGPPWNEKKTKGTLRWRMDARGGANGVSVSTAIRWVTEMRAKSNDPAMKYNAERTLEILKGLSTGAPEPAQPMIGTAKESPSQVAERFVDMESGLPPDHWSTLAEFFVSIPQPRLNKVHIVDIVNGIVNDDDTNSVESDDHTVGFDISTNPLGELDSSMRLSNYPSVRMLPGNNSSACYGDDHLGLTLLLSEKHWQIAPDGKVKELDGPLAWRIEDTFFEPLITLDTAIRYVTQMRDKTTVPIIKMNAVRTLTILNSYKQGKPLPKKLLSDSPAGCGG